MTTITIHNEDCFDTMDRMDKHSVDVVLTSPFYNTNKKAGKNRTLENTTVKDGKYNYVRYDVHVDNMTNDEYCEYSTHLFNKFDEILNGGGVFCTIFRMAQKTPTVCSELSIPSFAILPSQLLT